MGVNTRAHIDLQVFRQKVLLLIISRSICVKGRKELRMKAAVVMHMLSLRNLNAESYTRSLNVGGLVAVSRHLAISDNKSPAKAQALALGASTE